MMITKKLLALILGFMVSLLLGLTIVGCNQAATSSGATTTTAAAVTTTTSTTTTTLASATLTHFGFDFATGLQTEEAGVSDGSVINWNPDSVLTTVEGTTYPSWSTSLWWRGEFTALSSIAHQKHLGTVELSSVTSFPSTWDSGTTTWPLLVNHTYVVMCSPEGYAKFKVLVNYYPTWEVDVEYVFTTGESF